MPSAIALPMPRAQPPKTPVSISNGARATVSNRGRPYFPATEMTAVKSSPLRHTRPCAAGARCDGVGKTLEHHVNEGGKVTVNASKFLLQRLVDWGVTRIYGYPGDGINGLLGALEDFEGKLEFIQARHEEMAAFMACAHAKFTGEIGVCLATSGPGAIHLLNGLYDAKMDHVPVVAIVGQAATMAMGGSYQQEVDLQTLFKDVCDYSYTITSTTATRHIVDRAFRTAAGMRGVATIIFPKDLQEEDYSEPPRKHNTIHSGIGYSRPMVIPRLPDLQRAAEVLNGATKVAMLIGAGAKEAADEVIALADKLQACCAKALLGK